MFRIEDGRENFYQWDTNRKILVDDTSITEIHFCNKTDDCSLVTEVVDGVANVPNILLQDDWDIRVYAFASDYTKLEKRFKVVRRTKPADYIYTETEVKRFEDLGKRIYVVETNIENMKPLIDNNKTAISNNKTHFDSQLENLDKRITTNANSLSSLGTYATNNITRIDVTIGNIGNALNQIAALQLSYIGGAE